MFMLFVFLPLIFHVCLAANDSSISQEDSINSSIESDELNIKGRVIGGETAQPGQFPYVARLIIDFGSKYQSLCSATVLSDQIILTAAHCVYSGGKKAIRLWALIINKSSNAYVQFNSDEMHPHPGYNDQFKDDIALLKRANNQNLIADFGSPPELPTADILKDINTNTGATVAGWGKTSDSGRVSSTLQYAQLNVVSNDVCRRYFGSIITPKVICTLDRGKGICGGDSGGPLMITRGGKNYVIGVNAFGSTKCQRYAPSGYTNILSYMSWISTIIN